MIDKKVLYKSLIVILLLIIIIVAVIQVRNTLARYETTANTERDLDVAFWIVDNTFQTQRLLIQDIYPATEPYEYEFSVSNFKESKKAETDLEYSIVITATTNLPLSYTIQKNGTTFAAVEELYQDGDGTFYRELTLEKNETDNFILEEGTDSTDTYTLKVTFPLQYNVNLDYADLIENIEINLSAKQVIGEE